jgi:hypothetical protein
MRWTANPEATNPAMIIANKPKKIPLPICRIILGFFLIIFS